MAQRAKGGDRHTQKEVLIAAIGAIGVIITGVVSNWDKLFPPNNVVTATYSGYRPTGDPEVELRYFMEITGMRGMTKHMQDEVVKYFKTQSVAEHGNPELAEKVFQIVDEELENTFDQAMNTYIPIALKYLTPEQVQELNKFYSTPIMRELVRATPLINKEYMPLVMAEMQKAQVKVQERLEKLVQEEREKAARE
jgi:uncharacterized protein